MGTIVPEDTEWSHGEVHRALIQTAVLQGMHATENCIIEGFYVQAAPLVRQEMEAVEALREIRQGLRLSGRTPRLRTLKHHGRIYSQMTELAHFSKCELLHHLLWDGSSVLVDPRFNRKFARFLFATHLNALVGIALDAANLFEKLRGKHLLEVEQEHLEIALGILVEERIVSLKSVDGKVE
jgi:hypothetical protein